MSRLEGKRQGHLAAGYCWGWRLVDFYIESTYQVTDAPGAAGPPANRSYSFG